MSTRIGGIGVRGEHLAGVAFALVIAAFAMAPAMGQSPSAEPTGGALGVSPAPAGSAEPVTDGRPTASGVPVESPTASLDPHATLPPGGVTPLPAHIASGTCDAPGDQIEPLLGLIAGEGGDEGSQRVVYAAITPLESTLESLARSSGVIVVGGDPATPEGAVACGSLDAPAQGPDDLAIALDPANRSGYTGTVLLHQGEDSLTVTVVVVAPAARDAQAMPVDLGSPEIAEQGGTGGAMTSPVPRPSVQPGTSGAPPFSPLPQGEPPSP